MPGEQGDLLKRRRIIEPNTNRTGDGKPSAVRGIFYLSYHAFTQAGFGAFGQPQLRVILGGGYCIETTAKE